MTSRLMIVFYDLGLGGVQRKITDIIRYCQKTRPDLHITLCLWEKKGLFLPDIPQNIKIIAPPRLFRRFNLPWFTLWFLQALWQERPGTVLAFMDFCAFPAVIGSRLFFWRRIKILIGEDILTSRHLLTESHPGLRRFLLRRLYPLAAAVLVQTAAQKADLLRLLRPFSARISVYQNWLPLNFPPSKLPLARPVDILYLGRIDAQKNLSQFVKIIALLVPDFPRLKVRIVGSGRESANIKKLIRRHRLSSHIRFLPATSSPIRHYTAAKVYLLTSEYEGFPLTLLEAVSCGCHPVVPALKETVPFFRRYRGSVLYRSPVRAVRLISRILTRPDPAITAYYRRQIIESRSRLLRNYLQAII